ncbi:ankyrin repeat [Fusarium longipes]|uniref:Ankyrin repeat n=1 Tax=Fusarium longipes TaxID=694270 RepID=A0A395RRV0_9HYPO|nr:ankyrin repeat [Fusarium longipes]
MESFKARVKQGVDFVLDFTEFIISWMNKTTRGALKRLAGFNPLWNQNVDMVVNKDGQPRTKEEFLANIKKTVEGTAIEKFFKDDPKFIEKLAEKAAALGESEDSAICKEDIFAKTAQVTLHQQVLYCDDSSSMKDSNKCEHRWTAQNELINRIARVTTRILPEGEGVYLRYISQTIEHSDSLKFEEIPRAIQTLKPSGNTPIGTNLKTKILEPLVYSKLPYGLKRPILISVITDGAPTKSVEKESTFVEAIEECGDRLEKNGLPRQSVKFLIGQVGTAEDAKNFLSQLRNNTKIEDVVFVATLGEQF